MRRKEQHEPPNPVRPNKKHLLVASYSTERGKKERSGEGADGAEGSRSGDVQVDQSGGDAEATAGRNERMVLRRLQKQRGRDY